MFARRGLAACQVGLYRPGGKHTLNRQASAACMSSHKILHRLLLLPVVGNVPVFSSYLGLGQRNRDGFYGNAKLTVECSDPRFLAVVIPKPMSK